MFTKYKGALGITGALFLFEVNFHINILEYFKKSILFVVTAILGYFIYQHYVKTAYFSSMWAK